MRSDLLSFSTAIVAVSGLAVVVVEALRTTPWEGRPWDWFVRVKSRDPEWLLFGAGILLILLAGLAFDWSGWVLLAAPAVYVWVAHHLRTVPSQTRSPRRMRNL